MPQLGAASAGALPRLTRPLPQQQTQDGVRHRQHLGHPVGRGSLSLVEEGVARARVAGGATGMVAGGVGVVLGLPCRVVFGPLGLGRSPRGGVMSSCGGSTDGIAPTVACQCGAPWSGVQDLCRLWWAAPRRQAATLDGLSPTPVTLSRTLWHGLPPPLHHGRAGECPPPNTPNAHRPCHPPYRTAHAHDVPSRFCLFFRRRKKTRPPIFSLRCLTLSALQTIPLPI